jgi:hydroxypyruvate isomerase
MQRRTFLSTVPLAATLAASSQARPLPQDSQLVPANAGRLKQSLCRWCYSKVDIDTLCAEAVKDGLKAIDLVDPKEWAAVRSHGLTLTIVPGPTTIPDGFNRTENHAGIVERWKPLVDAAVAAKAYSIIVFSGNRKGMPDGEGLANTIAGVKRIMPYAEERGLNVVMELLNSKVNHKDYMCDHTPWGVEAVKGVGSPRFKLLYDIYHMQIMEGDVIRNIRDYHDFIGHYHTGGNPGRNEIDETQELNYHAVAKAIADTGFEGYFAHEFIPLREWRASLKQAVQICTV